MRRNADAQAGYLKDEAYYSLAGIYEETGKKDMALLAYKTIVKDYPKSAWLQDANRKVVELGGVTAAVAAKPPVSPVPGLPQPAAQPPVMKVQPMTATPPASKK